MCQNVKKNIYIIYFDTKMYISCTISSKIKKYENFNLLL